MFVCVTESQFQDIYNVGVVCSTRSMTGMNVCGIRYQLSVQLFPSDMCTSSASTLSSFMEEAVHTCDILYTCQFCPYSKDEADFLFTERSDKSSVCAVLVCVQKQLVSSSLSGSCVVFLYQHLLTILWCD